MMIVYKFCGGGDRRGLWIDDAFCGERAQNCCIFITLTYSMTEIEGPLSHYFGNLLIS